MKRRHFVQSLAVAAGASIFNSKESTAQGESQRKGKPFQIGILMHAQEERPIDQTAAGYDLIEIPVEIMVQPLKPEVVWNETLAMLKSWNLPPMKTSSHFLEGVLPVIGPVVDKD